MAKKTKAQNKGQNQRASEAPVSDEIRRAGERIEYSSGQLAAIRKEATRATDNLSEALAVIEHGHPEAAADCINRAALAIWQIRWELQAVPS